VKAYPGLHGARFVGSLVSVFLAAGSAYANISVSRSGSKIDASWSAGKAGTWEIVDDQGRVCASGAVNQGRNTLKLQKVASPVDLTLRIRNNDGTTPSPDQRIPGIKRNSNLRKPEGAARIYQVPVRSYFAKNYGESEVGKLREFTSQRLAEIKDLGVDYLWVTGVLEHSSRAQTDPDVVKGQAGSYYAIHDNWDVSSQIGTIEDFEQFIDRAHENGLRVIIDFVANHTARTHRTDIVCKQHIDFGVSDQTVHFFSPNNNYYYIGNSSFTPPTQNGADGADGVYDTDIFTPGIQLERPARVTGNDIISSTPQIYDWFETVKLNYGFDISNRTAHYDPMPRTWLQMLDVASYWIEKGVDGFRVDFAHAVPVAFWRYFATELKRIQPNVFLLAEAYETDHRMMIPGFSYYAMLDAGFDSVYDSELYWALHNQANRPGNMRNAVASKSPGFESRVVERGFMFTRYVENHDEQRVASRHFAQWIGNRQDRSMLGLAYSAYLGLMPGHLMLHGGQELQEDASVFGPYAGDNGRTSIFDFIYQSQTRTWLYGSRPQWMEDFRNKYRDLLHLKELPAFAARHSTQNPSFVDLDGANWYKDQSKNIAAYIRYDEDESYLVVVNADPFVAHEATVHFTDRMDHDALGALSAAGIENSDRRYVFREIFSRPGWVPRDPNVQGNGVPGWTLFKSGNVPSGLFLGQVPPATTYVFRIEAAE
jgi:glycosidase